MKLPFHLALLLPLALSACATGGRPFDSEDFVGRCGTTTTGLEARWRPVGDELVVVVEPMPEREHVTPTSGWVYVNGSRSDLVPRGETMTARAPFSGTARDLRLMLAVHDAEDGLLLAHCNRTDDETTRLFQERIEGMMARSTHFR